MPGESHHFARCYRLLVVVGLSLGIIIFSTSFLFVSNLAPGGVDDAVVSVMLDSSFLARALLEQQRVQNEFQVMIQQTQTTPSCETARILFKTQRAPFHGFANEIQFMVRYLQIAIATQRVFVLHPQFKSAYAPDDCDLHACLWSPVSNCTLQQNVGGRSADESQVDPLGIGIIKGTTGTSSKYFDSLFYGPTRVVNLTLGTGPLLRKEPTKLVDVVPHYERMYGRFWIRAQIAHYYWNRHMTQYLIKAMNSRLPTFLLRNDDEYAPRFIAFHIRKTDNVQHLLRDFGRNATVTRHLDRFMEIANAIRHKQNPNVRLEDIYVATDNQEVAELVSDPNNPHTTSWKFHLQPEVARASSDSKLLWFADQRSKSVGGIAADIETLRRANFLVGSFQSNVYRLAAELNIAYHTDKYLWTDKRIYTVDVEWYEDP